MTAPKIADGRVTAHTATMPNLTQVYFYYYREGLALNDPNFPAYRLANHVLGGHFTPASTPHCATTMGTPMASLQAQRSIPKIQGPMS